MVSPPKTDTRVMGVTREAPTTATGGLVKELKAQGQDTGEDAFDKRPAIAKQLNVGGFILEVDGDGTVYARRFGRCAHVSPLGHQVSQAEETSWGERVEISRLS